MDERSRALRARSASMRAWTCGDSKDWVRVLVGSEAVENSAYLGVSSGLHDARCDDGLVDAPSEGPKSTCGAVTLLHLRHGEYKLFLGSLTSD